MPPEQLSLESISLFFRYALSLTAWKLLHETRWSLRANPSSGNLHPTEGYAVLPAIERLGDAPAVYHYGPKEHALERRAILDAKGWSELSAPFPDGSFLVGLSSVHWREAWKYGERAFRYCQHDAGHALAAMRIAAAALGWGLVFLDGIGDSAIADLFGLSRGDDYGPAEREEPELLAVVTRSRLPSTSPLLNGLTAGGIGAQWCGRANTLSPEHGVEWPVIDEVAQATQVLYLEAEEAGIRSTGIGCYFDDPVHETSREWQSFYHFTVGGPVEDTRLTTLPAYNFEQKR